jgi:hypothetical protein
LHGLRGGDQSAREGAFLHAASKGRSRRST